MKQSVCKIFPGLLALWLLSACSKQTEQFQTDLIADYYPLQPGKYIIYRLDSTVFTNFNRVTEVHAYQVKHEVDAEVTDNLGRPSYRIYVYLRDSAGTQPWSPVETYFITPLPDQLEVIEDNLRVIKMHMPIRDGVNWKGNKYLPADPFGPLYNFSNDDYMEDWEFYYDGLAQPSETIENETYNDVLTVQQQYESYNLPPSDSAYAALTVSVDKFAKDIGLVYKEFTMWEQQPNPSGTPPNVTYNPSKTGFGVRMWMIDHN